MTKSASCPSFIIRSTCFVPFTIMVGIIDIKMRHMLEILNILWIKPSQIVIYLKTYLKTTGLNIKKNKQEFNIWLFICNKDIYIFLRSEV